MLLVSGLLAALLVTASATQALPMGLPASGKLRPVDPTVQGQGTVELHRRHKSLWFQVTVSGLPANPHGQSYTAWIRLRSSLLPLCSIRVDKSGQAQGGFSVAPELQLYLHRPSWIVLTRTENHKLERALVVATRRGEAPSYTGTPILRGRLDG